MTELNFEYLINFFKFAQSFLSYFLNEKFSLDLNTAEKITSLFLQYFRENRQPNFQDVHEWRLSIWRKALDPYVHLADEVYRQWMLTRYRYVKISNEVKSFLCELRKIYRLALISNGTSDAQWEKIEKCGLKQYFDCIVISGDTPWKKPDPNIFHKTCEELNVKPEQCLMIGDRVETDIEGAKKAGLAVTVWLNMHLDYQKLPSECNYPDFVVNHVAGLKQILSQLNAVNWDNKRR